MTTIQITTEFNSALTAIIEAGKTPWVIINGCYATGVYSGRTQAREAKVAENLAGKIIKAEEVIFEVINLDKVVQALHNGETKRKIVFEENKNDAIQAAADVALTRKAASLKAIPHTSNASTIERPCKRVWYIADEMRAADPHMKRKDVLARCVNEGIAFYTARTQYQQWLTIQHEMADREAQAKK